MEADSIVELDLREMVAPLTLLKLMQAFRSLDPGEALEILGTDGETRKELFQVLQPSRYDLVSSRHDGSCYRIRLRKRS